MKPVGRQWIYGALSLAILLSGLLAPLGGRIIARTGGRTMLAASGGVIAAGLTLVNVLLTLVLKMRLSPQPAKPS